MLGAACPQVVGQVQQLLVGPLRGVQLGLLALLLALLLTATPVNQSWIKNRSILILYLPNAKGRVSYARKKLSEKS